MNKATVVLLLGLMSAINSHSQSIASLNRDAARAYVEKQITSSSDFAAAPVRERQARNCVAVFFVDQIYSAGIAQLLTDALERRLEAIKESEDLTRLANAKCRPEGPSITELDILRLDFDALRGKKIKVRAEGIYAYNFFMLRKNINDMSPLPVDLSKVQREQRLEVIRRCGDIGRTCYATLQGIVGQQISSSAIVAEWVEIE